MGFNRESVSIPITASIVSVHFDHIADFDRRAIIRRKADRSVEFICCEIPFPGVNFSDSDHGDSHCSDCAAGAPYCKPFREFQALGTTRHEGMPFSMAACQTACKSGGGGSLPVDFLRHIQLPIVAKIHLFHALSFHWLGFRLKEGEHDLEPIFRVFPPLFRRARGRKTPTWTKAFRASALPQLRNLQSGPRINL
jgi:hypothetical protein